MKFLLVSLSLAASLVSASFEVQTAFAKDFPWKTALSQARHFNTLAMSAECTAVITAMSQPGPPAGMECAADFNAEMVETYEKFCAATCMKSLTDLFAGYKAACVNDMSEPGVAEMLGSLDVLGIYCIKNANNGYCLAVNAMPMMMGGGEPPNTKAQLDLMCDPCVAKVFTGMGQQQTSNAMATMCVMRGGNYCFLELETLMASMGTVMATPASMKDSAEWAKVCTPCLLPVMTISQDSASSAPLFAGLCEKLDGVYCGVKFGELMGSTAAPNFETCVTSAACVATCAADVKTVTATMGTCALIPMLQVPGSTPAWFEACPGIAAASLSPPKPAMSKSCFTVNNIDASYVTDAKKAEWATALPESLASELGVTKDEIKNVIITVAGTVMTVCFEVHPSSTMVAANVAAYKAAGTTPSVLSNVEPEARADKTLAMDVAVKPAAVGSDSDFSAAPVGAMLSIPMVAAISGWVLLAVY